MVVDVIAIVISLAALLFSFLQFMVERERNRKEATIHAFDSLEENKNVVYLFSLSKSKIDDLVERKKEHDKRIDEDWEKLNNALPLIEHFAVGINSNIYDIDTLNRMAGNKIISVFDDCGSFIQYKRNGDNKENNYIEFEHMVNALNQLREKNKSTLCM